MVTLVALAVELVATLLVLILHPIQAVVGVVVHTTAATTTACATIKEIMNRPTGLHLILPDMVATRLVLLAVAVPVCGTEMK